MMYPPPQDPARRYFIAAILLGAMLLSEALLHAQVDAQSNPAPPTTPSKTIAATTPTADTPISTKPAEAPVASPPKKDAQETLSADQLPEKCGLEVVSLRRTAANYMLDFRYRVLDPEKAAAFSNTKNKPYLIDQESGAKFAVPEPPKIGSLRVTRPPQAGKIAFIFFANPGQYIAAGKKVTIVSGNIQIKDLTVE